MPLKTSRLDWKPGRAGAPRGSSLSRSDSGQRSMKKLAIVELADGRGDRMKRTLKAESTERLHAFRYADDVGRRMR